MVTLAPHSTRWSKQMLTWKLLGDWMSEKRWIQKVTTLAEFIQVPSWNKSKRYEIISRGSTVLLSLEDLNNNFVFLFGFSWYSGCFVVVFLIFCYLCSKIFEEMCLLKRIRTVFIIISVISCFLGLWRKSRREVAGSGKSTW